MGSDPVDPAHAHEPLEEVDIRELASLVAAHGVHDLPWQLSWETHAQLGWPNQAYRLADAYILHSDPEMETIRILSLLTKPESRGKGEATALLNRVRALHPKKRFQVSALWPEEMGYVFTHAGFQLEALSQIQMQLQFD